MIEVRLEYGGMRASNTCTTLEEAVDDVVPEMIDKHAISNFGYRDPRDAKNLREATGRSMAGSRAFLYILDIDPQTAR